ncbi:MAG: nucleotidyltransferase [Deltaproteobacteria bacterium]|nr:nucleotidyltransferase [Deltaproteobacteria bacterium]
MFEQLISKTAEELRKAGIPYMVIGGQAVLLYGLPRMTKDIDITLGVDTRDLDKVVKAIAAIGLRIIPEHFESFVEMTFVLPARHEESGIRVDFIFSFIPYERQAIGRAKPVFLKGEPVMFASVEDVIIHKCFSGRPRDIEDARSVVIKNPDFDRAYVRRWLRELEVLPERVGISRSFEDLLA